MADPRITTKGLYSAKASATALSKVQWAIATGTDTITAAFDPVLTELFDGLMVGIRTAVSNATVTPNFNPDSLGSHTIVKTFDAALEPGDIPQEALLRFKASPGTWVLENPNFHFRTPSADWAAAGGAVDVITATYAPVHGSMIDGDVYNVRAAGANATTTPTFSPDAFPARIIKKLGGQALVPGDIYGANHEIALKYHFDGATPWFELLNPATASATPATYSFKELTTDAATFADDALAHAIVGLGVTLAAGAYIIRGRIHTTRAAGAGSHTTAFLFGGTAVITSIHFEAMSRTGDAAASAALNAVGFEVATGGVVKAASTSTTEDVDIQFSGVVIIGTGGTLLPELQYSGAPGGVTTPKAGSWMECVSRTNGQGTWA